MFTPKLMKVVMYLFSHSIPVCSRPQTLVPFLASKTRRCLGCVGIWYHPALKSASTGMHTSGLDVPDSLPHCKVFFARLCEDKN